jgi:Na+/proline symporter
MRMTQKQLEKWSKARQKGRNRYVLLTWVIGWGLWTALLLSVMRGYLDGWGEFPRSLALGVIAFPIGGYFLGQWTWKRSEKAFLRATQYA